MKRIAVYCGACFGSDPLYREAARELGREMVRRDIELVFGGGNVGLMGEISDAVLDAGGKAIGVMPRFLQAKEIAHDRLTHLILVDSMHERKLRMSELAEGFIAMPGGFGTLDEFFEMLSWAQLGQHPFPCALLNVAGFYDPLIHMLEHMTRERFIRPEHMRMVLNHADPVELLDMMEAYRTPTVEKWLDRKGV